MSSSRLVSIDVCFYCYAGIICYHLGCGLLEAIWVHGGHEVDAGVVDEVNDGLVALLVLVAEVLSQVDQQLSAHRLVAVHVGDVLKLWFACRGTIRHDTSVVSASHIVL